jgi:hypothetical protein
VVGSCEQRNEPSSSIEYWEFLEWLNDWWLLRRANLHEVY